MADREKKYDIYGIGNALVDILVEVDDNLLKQLKLKKGNFNMATNELSKKIFKKIEYMQAKICSGGSAANTIATMAMLGAKAAFCGKVGDDEYAKLYESEINEIGVTSCLRKTKNMTGHCIVLVTPDAERTFIVNYGAAGTLSKEDIGEEEITASSIVHIEGYQIGNQDTKEACLHAIHCAKRNSTKVSIDINDQGIIESIKEELKNLIKNDVDILFANEKEAKALTGKEPEEALEELSKICPMVIVKCGEHGSFIKTKDQTIKIRAVKTNAIDTTGAGDAYAAGFLYGLTKGMSLEDCGNLGSALGAKVVAQIGARLGPEIIKER